MTAWPPDGLFRIAPDPDSSGFPVVVAGGITGVYTQPVPPASLTVTPNPVLVQTSGAVTAAGNTALWTPTSGKRFCLVAWAITISGNASRAAGAATAVQLRDGAATIIADYSVFIPGSSVTTLTGDDIILTNPNLGVPFASAAVNNVLNVNIAAALATGQLRATAWGFETI